MRKVFIDCGAHDGCSVRKFLDITEDGAEYEVYSFEPNPKLAHHHPVGDAVFYDKAVWTSDGPHTFYMHGTTGGSTLVEEKNIHNTLKAQSRPSIMKVQGLPEAITVECIDISKWISTKFAKEDYIVLKMDIEGAEYQILDKMIAEGTIDYINEFAIEWHLLTSKGVGPSLRKHIKQQIGEHTQLFEQKGIKLIEWDAMHTPYLLDLTSTVG